MPGEVKDPTQEVSIMSNMLWTPFSIVRTTLKYTSPVGMQLINVI